MSKGRDELTRELLAAAEESIEALLRWSDQQAAPKLSEIEQVVLEVRQKLSQKMAEAVIERQTTVQPVPGPACAGCGGEVHYKDKQSKVVTSWVGELRIERGYYYCDHCKRGLFPPGPAVGTL